MSNSNIVPWLETLNKFCLVVVLDLEVGLEVDGDIVILTNEEGHGLGAAVL